MSIDASAVIAISYDQAKKNYPAELAKALARINEVGEMTGSTFAVDQFGLGHFEDTPTLMLSTTADGDLMPGQRGMLFMQPIEKPAAFTLAEFIQQEVCQ